MKLIKIILSAVVITSAFTASGSDPKHYVGGDISLLPLYENAGAQYKDEDGNSVRLLPYVDELGMNAMRVRLFVDPESFEKDHPFNANDPDKTYDPNACQSLPFILPLCSEIINNGMDLMLDFHYSDNWADPAKQWIPKAWEGLSDTELSEKLYDYTKSTLQELKNNGIVPTFIQPGNEISYGMLWGPFGKDNNANHVWNGSSEASWKRLGELLKSAIKACREVCPDAEIIIHTERVAEVDELKNFYAKMEELNIDYDIIGLSYYPYFHGPMSVLNQALTTMEAEYPSKPIMIVETGFPYAWEVPGSNQKVEYTYSLEGQNLYAQDLVSTLENHSNVTGLFWWWLEYNAYGANFTGQYASYYNKWYNAPLFDSRTGKATPALKTICSFNNESGSVDTFDIDKNKKDDRWFDLNGRGIPYPLSPGFYIHNGKTVLIP